MSIKIVSKDLDTFEITKEEASLSELLNTMIQEETAVEETIPVPNVTTKILKLVVEFLKEHVRDPMKNIDKPLVSTNMKDIVQEWYADFLMNNDEEMFELILAANFMDIKSLLDLTCAYAASKIKGKAPEEIRRMFDITNDFTPEEESQIREENKWSQEY